MCKHAWECPRGIIHCYHAPAQTFIAQRNILDILLQGSLHLQPKSEKRNVTFFSSGFSLTMLECLAIIHCTPHSGGNFCLGTGVPRYCWGHVCMYMRPRYCWGHVCMYMRPQKCMQKQHGCMPKPHTLKMILRK